MEGLTYEDVFAAKGIEYLMAMSVKVYYHQGHSWVIPECGHVVRVGIDDFAQKLVGKIDGIKLPQVGSEVAQGKKGWSLLADSKSIDMPSPVDGIIIETNQDLLNSPALVSTDPYGEFWLMKVEAPNLSTNLKNLLSGGLARKWMEESRENLFARMDYKLGSLSQDGGVPVDGIAKNLDRARWDEITKEFFLIQ